jgi:uncharacterized alpha-E superfamily protein
MLSRVADSIYWMARYVERAENVARFVHVNLSQMLDVETRPQQWQPLVNTTGDEEDFTARYGEATEEKVIQFLTFDAQNPNSILSCVRAARENARSTREIISSEMWLQINQFYLFLKSASAKRKKVVDGDFFTEIKLQSHLFNGVMDGTMTHGEAWHFAQLARALERADKTSRLLDVKYFMLLRSVSDVGTAFDDVQWAAVLRSASAFEMYRKRHGRISPNGVAEFLILDREFPRAVHFCLLTARESLHAITGTPIGRYKMPCERLVGQLCSDLSYSSIEEIIGGGLHEYLDNLQSRINEVGTGIFESFFAAKTRPSEKAVPRRQAQSQTQT